jgi:HEAT repeat protein
MKLIDRTPLRLACSGLAPFLALVLLSGACPAAASPASRDPRPQIAFEDVVASLKVGDPRVRLDALQKLAQAGYLEAAGSITPLLTDSVAEVQNAAIDSLLGLFLVDEAYTRKYGNDVVRQKGAQLPLLAFAQGRGQLVANQFPADVIKGLVTCLDSSVAEVRFNATYALGVFAPLAATRGAVPDGKTAVQRLTAMARDPNPLLRLAATQVLGRLYEAALRNDRANGDILAQKTGAGDQVIAGMNDPDLFVRQASLRAAGEMRNDRAVQSLLDLLGYYKSGTLARLSLEAVARIAHPGSLSAMTALLESTDEQLRAHAVAGIGRTGDKPAFSNLEVRTARDKSAYVKLAMAFARARGGDLSQVVTIAEGFSKSKLAPVAFEYLVELGPVVTDALAPIGSHQDADVRAGVAEVLGIIGNAQSVFVVQSLSRDKNEAVSAAGVRSAKRLSPRPANAPRMM